MTALGSQASHCFHPSKQQNIASFQKTINLFLISIYQYIDKKYSTSEQLISNVIVYLLRLSWHIYCQRFIVQQKCMSKWHASKRKSFYCVNKHNASLARCIAHKIRCRLRNVFRYLYVNMCMYVYLVLFVVRYIQLLNTCHWICTHSDTEVSSDFINFEICFQNWTSVVKENMRIFENGENIKISFFLDNLWWYMI